MTASFHWMTANRLQNTAVVEGFEITFCFKKIYLRKK